jgi:hypothetical protein
VEFRKRRQLSTLGILAGLAAASLPVVWLAEEFDPRRRGEPAERVLYLPRGRSLNYMCVGYRGVAADLVWIRSVMYVGRKIMKRDRRYEWMEKLYHVTTDLDPHWTRPYHAGAVLLSALPQDDERAMKLLRRGMNRNGWNRDIPFQAAQLNLLRNRTKDSLAYLKLIHRCMRPRPLPDGSPPSLSPHDASIIRTVPLLIRELYKEGGDFREAVSMAVHQLSTTEDKVWVAVGRRGYREAMARLLEYELTGAARHYKSLRRRWPVNVRELIELPETRVRLRGRDVVLPSVKQHFLKRMTRTCRGDARLAAEIFAYLPRDPYGMKLYVRSDGTVHSRGLERTELKRVYKTVNLQIERYREAFRRPPANLDVLIRWIRAMQEAGRTTPGTDRFFKVPAVYPPHPMGKNWSRVALNASGRLAMPEGPDVSEMLSAPYAFPPGPKARAGLRAAPARAAQR